MANIVAYFFAKYELDPANLDGVHHHLNVPINVYHFFKTMPDISLKVRERGEAPASAATTGCEQRRGA